MKPEDQIEHEAFKRFPIYTDQELIKYNSDAEQSRKDFVEAAMFGLNLQPTENSYQVLAADLHRKNTLLELKIKRLEQLASPCALCEGKDTEIDRLTKIIGKDIERHLMSETNIPSEIKEKINDYVKGSKPAWVNPRQVDCEYGYLLASKTIDEKDDEIERLQDIEIELEKKTKSSKEWCNKAMEMSKLYREQASTIAALQAEKDELEQGIKNAIDVKDGYKEECERQAEVLRKIKVHIGENTKNTYMKPIIEAINSL